MKKLLISIVLVSFVFVLGIGCVSATSNFTTGGAQIIRQFPQVIPVTFAF